MVKFDIKNLSIWFGEAQALKNVTLQVHPFEILSVIGPSNSGKTSFLRMLNRLNELQANFKMNGEVEFNREDLTKLGLELLRKAIGMVFNFTP